MNAPPNSEPVRDRVRKSGLIDTEDGMRLGPYEMLETIGRGGMGVVYRARHQETGQQLAIKILHAQMASNSVIRNRFEREIAAANRLRHPHIVQGLAFGREGEQLYLVMELVEGQTLGERIRHQGPLSGNEAIRIILQIADALQLAHQHNLIHRDVKPDNILLTRDGQAKLADLGLVKDLSSRIELTSARTGLGTIAYVAPEQSEDARKADVRSDVYALAATLYHALTGSVPFPGSVNAVVLKKKLLNEFVAPRRLVPSLNERIDAVICRALDQSPDQRPSSCEEFAAELRAGCQAMLAETDLIACTDGDPPHEKFVDPADRRTAYRFPLDSPILCWTLQHTGRRWRGELRDISVGGVQLHLKRRFEPGALLSAEVLDAETAPSSSLYMKVRWVRKVAAGQWALGCAFVREVTTSDVDAMLGNVANTVVTHQMPPI